MVGPGAGDRRRAAPSAGGLRLVRPGERAGDGRGDGTPAGHPRPCDDREAPPTGREPTGLVHALAETVTAMRADGPIVTHRAALADLLVGWAESLVALHGAPVPDDAAVTPLPWVLEADTLADRLGALPAGAGRAWAVAAHPRVRRALAQARADWLPDRWVHHADAERVALVAGPGPVAGPLHEPGGAASASSSSSALPSSSAPSSSALPSSVAPSSPALPSAAPSSAAGVRTATARTDLLAAQHAAAPRTVLTGAGRGDARWDVATALDWLAVNLAPALEPAWELDPVTAFMRAYRGFGGEAEPSRAMAVARTVATAAEWSASLDAREGPAGEDEHAWVAGLWARPLTLVAPR